MPAVVEAGVTNAGYPLETSRARTPLASPSRWYAATCTMKPDAEPAGAEVRAAFLAAGLSCTAPFAAGLVALFSAVFSTALVAGEADVSTEACRALATGAVATAVSTVNGWGLAGAALTRSSFGAAS